MHASRQQTRRAGHGARDRSTGGLLALGLSLALSLFPSIAAAHHPAQHGSDDGHLPAVSRNVSVVGKLDLFGSAEQPDRIADVAAFGNYAYLGAYAEPDCDIDGGVFVVDISDPAAPERAGFIPTTPGSYVGEGVQILDMNTPRFQGQVLIHNNESCVFAQRDVPTGLGGMSLWDVTDPENPKPLAKHVGDPGPTGIAHMIHSAFGWQDGDRAYAVMVDDEEQLDIDIMDITDPANPVLVSETNLDAETSQQPAPQNDDEAVGVGLHDMVVKELDGQMLMLASYWDGGYAILNVDDPAAPVFLRDSDFAATEPFAGALGLPEFARPEGNAHQAEFNFDNRYILAADENFGPRQLIATIASGPFTGHGSQAKESTLVAETAGYGSEMAPLTLLHEAAGALPDTSPKVDTDSPLAGPTTFIGDACTPAVTPAPSPDHIALIESAGGVQNAAVAGSCTYTQKTLTAHAAGYAAAVIFNSNRYCEEIVNVNGFGPIPMVATARSTGLKLLGQNPADPCTADTPPVGTPSEAVRVEMVHDGWGYLHLFDTETMEDLGQYAIPESLDTEHAEGSGSLSVHEVATDPRRNLAYLSYYSGGLRVVSFGDDGIREVGAFIAEGGSEFWGVEYHQPPGRKAQPLILASDRDSGLWIFQYKPGHDKPRRA